MKNFEIFNPVKIIFGSGEAARAGEECAKTGKKALVITGKKAVKETGILDKVLKSLDSAGVKHAVFTGVSPNPKVTEVDSAGELGKKENCDFVIGLGGGSVMDAAKGAAITVKNPGSLWDYVALPGKKAENIGETLPIILIPTLAATGSEGNPAAVFTNAETSQKAAIYNPAKIFPAVSIVDPELTLSVPELPTAEGVIDVIMHVLEEYLTGETDCELQDRITEGIVLTCIENGRELKKNLKNKKAREQVSLSSTVALQGLPNSGRAGSWVVHPMEHAVSGMYDSIAHGSGIAALLPPYLKYLGEVKPDKVIQLSRRVFGSPEDAAGDEHVHLCAEGFRSFIKEIGMKDNLKDMGVKEGDIEKLADKVIEVSGSIYPNMDKKQLVRIFKEAYEGN